MTIVDDRLLLARRFGWTLALHTNQAHLGRAVVSLDRPFEGSIAGLTPDELTTLRDCLAGYEELMQRLFQPDRINYAQLGNQWPQLHLHAIPRYAAARTWNGITFHDTRWGGAPWPEAPSPLDGDQTAALAAVVRAVIAR